MKKNIKGFTLVELLAVIVILGIIMTIAGTSLIGTRKKANKKEAKNIENTITKVGEELYAHESMLGNKDDAAYFYQKYKTLGNGSSLKITIEALKKAGYLKSSTISNPSGKGNCKGYLEVIKKSSGPEFKGYVCCPNLYQTDKTVEPTDCTSYDGIADGAKLTNN